MGHPDCKERLEIKDSQENKDQLALLGKKAHQVLRVYQVKESLVKMVCQASLVCQGLKVIQVHQDCLESQGSQDLVNQDFQDQRVIRVWLVHLDLKDQREKRGMGDCLECLVHLDQMVHQDQQVLLGLLGV